MGWLAPRLLLLAQCVAAVLFLRAWLNAGTYRLYLDDRADVGSASEARQRFVVEGTRVVPQILTQDADGFRFRLPETRRGLLRFRVRPDERASIQARWSDGVRQETLAARVVTGPEDLAFRLPGPGGSLDVASQGTVVWSDLRVEETFPWLHGMALALLLALRLPLRATAWSARERFLLVRAGAMGTAALIAVIVLETGLRVAAWTVPSLMAVERSRLGEAAPDPHWHDTQRYGRMPRANRDGTGEWVLGDIVRMGFVPQEASPGLLHRYPVRTDEEGFRNEPGLARAEVAALGDSFTDALTLPAELSWPARLEARLRRGVRNYGVAGFGPQQELRVLQDFALPKRPRVVVVAFFAGNDVMGASSFDEFERSGATNSLGVSGWPFKRVVARFDRSYAFLLAQRLLAREAQAAGPSPADGARRFDAEWSGEDPSAPALSSPSFDRGLYALPVGGRTLRFALMPPYLNLLNFDRARFESLPGWELTRRSLLAMDAACRASGARLVVMFIPAKCQVYLPLVDRAFAAPQRRRALAVSLAEDPGRVDVDRLSRNRLVQNELVGGFCRRQEIAFLDLTPELSGVVESGRNVYFPDDSHWNALGHQVAADRLAQYLEDPFLHADRP